MKLPPAFSTGDPSYFVVASTSGIVSPSVLTISKMSARVRFGRLRFIDIAPLIERTLERVSFAGPGSIEECVEIDGGARRVATELLARRAGGRA